MKYHFTTPRTPIQQTIAIILDKLLLTLIILLILILVTAKETASLKWVLLINSPIFVLVWIIAFFRGDNGYLVDCSIENTSAVLTLRTNTLTHNEVIFSSKEIRIRSVSFQSQPIPKMFHSAIVRFTNADGVHDKIIIKTQNNATFIFITAFLLERAMIENTGT
jgi:hypothetical protein